MTPNFKSNLHQHWKHTSIHTYKRNFPSRYLEDLFFFSPQRGHVSPERVNAFMFVISTGRASLPIEIQHLYVATITLDYDKFIQTAEPQPAVTPEQRIALYSMLRYCAMSQFDITVHPLIQTVTLLFLLTSGYSGTLKKKPFLPETKKRYAVYCIITEIPQGKFTALLILDT